MVALRTNPAKLQKTREHRQKCKETGRCVRCPSAAVPGRTMCQECARKVGQENLERYRRKCIQQIEAGLCLLCPNPSPVYAICDHCRGKAAARLQAKRKQKRAGSLVETT